MGYSQWIDRYSRWQYSEVYKASNANVYAYERETLAFPPEGSYTEHIVKADDNVFSLAGYYYYGLLQRASSLWWAIAEINDVVDPTQQFKRGSTVYIPDFQYVMWWLSFIHEVLV